MSDVPMINVFCTITVLNGVKVPVSVPTSITPTALRTLVAKETKIPLDQLRLIFRGRMIKDDDTQRAVEEYKLEDESVLHCMGKPLEDETTAESSFPYNGVPSVAVATTATATATTTGPSNSTISSNPTLSTATAAVAAATSTVPSAAYATASAPHRNSNSINSTTQQLLPSALLRLKMNSPPSIYQTALTTLEKILLNITSHPMEDKYRKVKRQNAAFQKRLGGLIGGHDTMLAAGFVVEIQEGSEVYQLHASPEQWPRLVQAKEQVELAIQQSKMQHQVPATHASNAAGGGGSSGGSGITSNANSFGMGGGLSGGLASMDPNMQTAVAQMMSNPDALRSALQNPMIQDMIRNDPNVSPMMGTYLEQMANNPAMLDQVTQRMQDPSVRAQLQNMIMATAGGPGGGGTPGMIPGMGGGGMGNTIPSATNVTSNQQYQGNDQDQTEDEMIAEAIRRSLEER